MALKSRGTDYEAFTLFGIILVFEIGTYLFLYHLDADDSYYLAKTNMAMDTNSIHQFDPASGLNQFQFQSTYSLVSWGLFLAVVCKSFRLNAVELAHTYLLIVLLLVHYNIYPEQAMGNVEEETIWKLAQDIYTAYNNLENENEKRVLELIAFFTWDCQWEYVRQQTQRWI